MKISDSQNYINNSSLVKNLLKHVDFTSQKIIIEIGPGKGIITDFLIAQNCKVIAIEADEKLCSQLQKKYKKTPHLSIIHADFLRYTLPQKPFMVVANIPFNITADIIRKLIDSNMQSAYLIMQKEAAHKYIGAPIAHSPLRSHIIKNRFEIAKIMDVNRKNYTPKPKFDTLFISFKRRKKPIFENKSEQLFYDFLTYVFQRRNKDLSKALKHIMSSLQIKILCKEIGINKDVNIKTIVFDDWVRIFKTFEQHSLDTSKSKISGKYKKLLKSQSALHKRHRTFID